LSIGLCNSTVKCPFFLIVKIAYFFHHTSHCFVNPSMRACSGPESIYLVY
jgi:hypothetical protein